MTDFIIEHQCPQCGAPAELSEADRLFSCPFCRVKSYLVTPDFFRYILPHRAPAGKEIFYYPYWRFKGMLFSSLAKSMESRFIDASHQALPSGHFPVSIGFRGQTQKLRFAEAQAGALFWKPVVPFEKVLAGIREQFSPASPQEILSQEFIGETKSLIYTPVYFDPGLTDAVLNRPLSDAVQDDMEAFTLDPSGPGIRFIPALCPECGGDLQGEAESLVLACKNCGALWREREGKLRAIRFTHLPTSAKDCIYLPFWRIEADISPLQLETYADLVNVANIPKVAQPGWEKIPFYFWNPAFKVRPQNYLTLAGNLTLSQPRQEPEEGAPMGKIHGVTLSLPEAVETLKLTLAHIIRPISRRLDLLPQTEIRPRKALLVYIPFQDTNLDLIQPDLNVAVNKSALFHARNL